MVVATKHEGIILKTFFPYKQKVMLLERSLGKIPAIPPSYNWQAGTRIAYCAHQQNTIHFLSEIELLSLPLEMGKGDIDFLHHVLELCYYYLSLGVPALQVYDLLALLYDPAYACPSNQFKLLYIFKLLLLLGMYPEDKQFQMLYFNQLAHEPIDTLLQEPLRLEVEQALDVWIRSCIALHPLYRHFNTRMSLGKSDRVS